MKYLVFLPFLLIACHNQLPKTPTNAEASFKTNIENYLDDLKQEERFYGSLEILQADSVVYHYKQSFKSPEFTETSGSPDQYRIASITKSFTAVLIFKAIEAGKLDLYQSIAVFFPDLKEAELITISHLLHHQSGILSYTKDDYFWEHRLQAQSPEKLLEVISQLELEFSPGSNTKYSNSNYFLLAQILESLYQKPYARLLEEQIFGALQLQQTSLKPMVTEKKSFRWEEENWQEFRATHLSLAKGSGSLYSSPGDLNRFYRALIQGELIHESSLQQMKEIVRRHGRGLFRYDIQDQIGFGHGGNIDGFQSIAVYFEELDLAISICSNASQIQINEVFSEVLKRYLGERAVPISAEELQKYAGIYLDTAEPEDSSVFEVEGEQLILVIKGEFRQPLAYKGEGRFLFNQMYGGSISFTFSANGEKLMFEQGEYRGHYQKQKDQL